MHVAQAPSVWSVTAAHLGRAGKGPIRIVRCPERGIVLVTPVEVGHGRSQSRTIMECRSGPGPTGVLPLRLGRQPVGPARRQESGLLLQPGQLEAVIRGVVPAHLFY